MNDDRIINENRITACEAKGHPHAMGSTSDAPYEAKCQGCGDYVGECRECDTCGTDVFRRTSPAHRMDSPFEARLKCATCKAIDPKLLEHIEKIIDNKIEQAIENLTVSLNR